MQRHYTKDGKRWYGGYIILNGRTVFNPSHEQLIAAGYEAHEVKPYVPTLDKVKAAKMAEIGVYDVSPAVNSFTLNGQQLWLEFEERQRVRAKIQAEEDSGREVTTLWLGTKSFTMPIALAKALIKQIEVYAGDALGVTSAHKKAVEELETIADVEAYDHTTGYPEKLSFTI